MRVFVAGNEEGISVYRRKWAEDHSLPQLFSYFKFKIRAAKANILTMKNVDLFLDSGAFSAFTQNVTIDIQEYIGFIKEHQAHLSVYANLDSIGDAEATLKNQKIMEKAGLKPLPCFHYNEPIRYLEHYLAHYDYIALGGMVPISTQDLAKWLDLLFSKYICDKNGKPKVKIHGFGLTSLPLMMRYPWWSVDSTSWVMASRLGQVYVPRQRSGKWVYDEQTHKVQVSSRSPSKGEAGEHIEAMSPRQKAIVLQYFKEKGYELGESSFKTMDGDHELAPNEKWWGKLKPDGKREVEIIKVDGLSNNYKKRDEMNIIYFLDLEKALPKWPWAFKTRVAEGFGL